MACFGDVNSISVCLVALPLSDVLLSILIPPHPVALHRPILKVTNIILIIILQGPFSMRPIIPKIANIDRSVWKFLVALSTLEV